MSSDAACRPGGARTSTARDASPGRRPSPPEPRLGSSDCERLRPGLLAQPVNTVTSLGYVAAGVAVALRADRAHRGTAAAAGTLLVLVGLGSVAFHGPQPPGARTLHDLPIAGLVGLFVTVPLLRVWRAQGAMPGWGATRGWALAGLGAGAAVAYAGGRSGACTCDPDSPVQLHGAWHLISAAGFVVLADILDRSVGRG